MAGPYGITQVDVPGILNAYTVGQDRRMSRMLQAEQLREAQVKLDQTTQAAQALKNFYSPPTGGVQGAADSYGAPATPAAPPSATAGAPTSPVDDPTRQQQLLAALAPTMKPEDVIALQNGFSQHNAEQRKAAADAWSQIGNEALEIRNVPESQRLALFDQRTPMLQSLGIPPQILQQVRGQIANGNSDQYLEGLVNHARNIETVIKGETPTTLPVAGVGVYPVVPGSPFRDFSKNGAMPAANVGAGQAPNVKVLNGKTYHQDPATGDWYEGEPAGNGGSGFPNIERYYGGE